jgi:hypothetical protein
MSWSVYDRRRRVMVAVGRSGVAPWFRRRLCERDELTRAGKRELSGKPCAADCKIVLRGMG